MSRNLSPLQHDLYPCTDSDMAGTIRKTAWGNYKSLHVECKKGYGISEVQSEHHNKKEDRCWHLKKNIFVFYMKVYAVNIARLHKIAG